MEDKERRPKSAGMCLNILKQGELESANSSKLSMTMANFHENTG